MIVSLLLLAAQPAGAPDPSPSASPTPPSAEATSGAQPVRYCVRATTTGTRMVRKTCYTRAEWLKQGYDPLAPTE